MDQEADLVVVGAGAAGLAAGIFAAEAAAAAGTAGTPAAAGAARPAPRIRIVLLDGAAKIGRKILISGGGRCNVTHERVLPEDFHGPRPTIRRILGHFDEKAAAAWFASLGVPLKREATGKLFPVSDRAQSVLDALVRRCEALSVEIRSGTRVDDVFPLGPRGEGFAVRCVEESWRARRVVLATGGCSLPRTGSDGGGLAIARRLEHSVSETVPALVPLVLDSSMFHAALAGVSHPAEIAVRVAGGRCERRQGSLLWTHFGVSGPVVLDASRDWTLARARGESVEITVSFLPGSTREDVERWILAEAAAHPRRTLARLLASRMPERLADALARHAGVDPGTVLAQFPREARRSLADHLVALPLPVVRDRGWDHAEVTAGGVPLEEVDPRTMESRRTPGIHLIGEMLDCDGRIGGFSFQWAWSTGFIAGTAAGRALADPPARC